MNRFVEYLEKDTNLSPSADTVYDYERPGKKPHIFILYTQGHKLRAKFYNINKALTHFVLMQKMKKVASWLNDGHRCDYEYQSITWETMLKLLFFLFC